MKKQTWKVASQAECQTCGWMYENVANAQAIAAKHAKRYGHLVNVDTVLASEYDGRE